jgi:hypothetical protein
MRRRRPSPVPALPAASLGRLVLVALLAASGCASHADPDATEGTMRTWDLTRGRDIAQIGWHPESPSEDLYLQRHSRLRIELPEGVVVDVAEAGGPARVSAVRWGRELDMMLLEFPRTTIAEASDRAADLARRYGIDDGGAFAGWRASRPSWPGPNTSTFASREFQGGRLTLDVEARVRSGQDGVVLVGLTW